MEPLVNQTMNYLPDTLSEVDFELRLNDRRISHKPLKSGKRRENTKSNEHIGPYQLYETDSKSPSQLNLSIPPQRSMISKAFRELSWPYFRELNARLWGVVLPAIMSNIALLAMETISMMFVGHLNNQAATAGVGMAIIFVNLTTHSTLMGLNNAISVLVPVSYGQQDLQDCERVLQRGRIICLLCYLPLIIL